MSKREYGQLFGERDYPVLLTSPQNVFYTVGFHTTARRPAQIGCNCVLMKPEGTYFFFPAGWLPLVQEQVDFERIEPVPYHGGIKELAERIAGVLGDAKSLGYEQDGMELSLYLALRQAWRQGAEGWRDVSSCLQRARLVKSQEEIFALRASAEVARAAMEHAKRLISPGISEMDLVAELEYFMRKRGSEGVPFTMKALAGENAARTINLPGNYRVQKGDMVLLDFGAVVCGYASDWTRTFAVEDCGEKQQELYQLVWKVERSCIERIRPGVTFQDLMDQAMETLYGHPFAKWFNPYLGHSIGINSQEWPTIIPGAEEVLKENMVITIEPGIYIPGLGGLRIEDMVLVTADGPEILTGLEKEEFVLTGNRQKGLG